MKGAAGGSVLFSTTVPRTDLSGLGTGIADALGINVGIVGSPIINGGALGTPSGGNLANATGLPISTGVSGLGAGVATALGNAANSANGFATFGAVQAVVANNTALSSLPSTYATAVARLGYYALGDSEPLIFVPSGSACSLGAGAGNGVTQFPTSDGKCWIAQTPNSVWDAAWAGLDNTGSSSNSVKLQALIDALPDKGGTIKINQCGFYNFTSTVHIGNGTSTTPSTRRGVHIVGNGDVMLTPVPAAPLPCVQFSWTGPASGGPVVSFDGPLNGWGLENIYFYGNNSGASAFQLHAASDGYSRGVVANNFIGHSVVLDTYSSAGYPGSAVYNTGRNIIENMFIATSDHNGAIGLILDGPADGSTDPSLNTFINLNVSVGTLTPGNVGVGIYLAVADTNLFINPLIFGAYSAASYGLVLDYSKNSIYPTANSLVGGALAKDPGVLGQAVFTVGSPYYTSAPNYLNGMQQVNGATISPNVTGISTDLPRIEFPTLSASNRTNNQSGTLFQASMTSLYRVCAYLTTQTAGTAGTASFSLTWNDGIAHSFTSTAPLDLTSTAETSSDCRILLANVSTNVSWGINLAGVTGTPAFGYYITTERLN
ncbi:hypothetical protein [Methylosinus sp. PW1]|uniref:hypothetical protein n=1 Tax=Methylosinus sp. PW1 TaxID=107636 RepID=UPI0012EBE99C|nr:hypothetical protein [Methylosinus sp. PW1]